MDNNNPTQEELEALRLMLRAYQAKVRREAQARAAKLTKELSAQYGTLNRVVV